jgi:citrate lyase subunit beta/citryl-CoA lyase
MFVPGNNRTKIAEAVASEVDVVVLDLEDLVPIAEKGRARETVVDILLTTKVDNKLIGVRINSWQSPFGKDDIRAIIKARPALIRLPKCNCVEDMQEADELISKAEEDAGITVGTTKVIASIE